MAEGVDQLAMLLGIKDGLVFVLAMDINEAFPRLGHQGGSRQLAVDETAGLSGGAGIFPFDVDFALLWVDPLFPDQPRDRAFGKALEDRFHGHALRPLAQKPGVKAVPQEEIKGVHDEGLPRAGLSGQDVEIRPEFQAHGLDDGEILDGKLAEHGDTIKLEGVLFNFLKNQ